MRRAVLWLGGVVLVCAATAGLVWMASSGAASFRVDGTRLIVSGTLTLSSTERIDSLIEQNPGITTIVLEDIDRDSDSTPIVQKGALIRVLGLDTELAPGVTLAGDAVYLFLAGVERRMGEGAELLVSDWQTPVGPASALPADHPAHTERRRYVDAMLGGPGFYGFMINAAPVGEGHRVGPSEVAEYGLVTGG